jgi:hypothetical protein
MKMLYKLKLDAPMMPEIFETSLLLCNDYLNAAILEEL